MTDAGSTSSTPGRDLAACAFVVSFFCLWFAPGVFGGQIYFVEDIASYFFANRANLHSVAQQAGLSWWDPLPGLGLPRLANLQSGYWSPFSVLFYLFPTASVFAVYPALVLSTLSLFCFGLFRLKGLATLPALFGALAWASLGNVTAHVQHLPFIETLVWLPGTLLAWELFRRNQKGGWAALAGVGVAFQCVGAPQFAIYNGLVMGVWIGLDLFDLRADSPALRRSLIAAVGVALLGASLASWQLLPSFEFAQHSHRTLIDSAERFASMGRAAPSEVLLALVAESFWFFDSPPTLSYGAPYPNLPNLSALTLAFAVFAAFGQTRRRWEWAAVAFFLLGMLGAAGGVTTLLGWLLPFADRIRAPIRMIVPAGFLLAWLAACGMQRLSLGNRLLGRLVALAAILWLGVLSWSLQWRDDRYVDPDFFAVPPAIASAQPRVAVDIRSSTQDLPLFAINAGIAAGVPTLVPRAALRPGNYFEALFASQHGSLEQSRKLDRMISATVLGFTDASLPLIRSFGLGTLLGYRDGQYQVLPVASPNPRFFLAPRVNFLPDPRARWAAAASTDWDPRIEVISASPVDAKSLPAPELVPAEGEEYGRVRVLLDEPDAQSLEVESQGGVLVTSGLFFPGWQVRVDGEQAEVREMNLALRAVLVGPGRHRVDWQYRPTWLSSAVWLSVLAALIAAGMGLLLRGNAILATPSRGWGNGESKEVSGSS